MEAGSSNSSGQLSGRVVNTRGKHRIQAELKRLEQEARFLEEELEQLEKMDSASASCLEFLDSVDSKPDPFLPETTGPVNATWDQWFEGPKEAKRCGCAILWSSFPLNFCSLLLPQEFVVSTLRATLKLM